MTTEQTASHLLIQKLRLAADILETRHPWEHSDASSRWVSVTNEDAHPLKVLADGRKIRLVLATPPDNRPLHNPDNLTAEQVGAGWRLLLAEELDGRMERGRHGCEYLLNSNWTSTRSGSLAQNTYRVPLSVPWPEAEKPDPYAELKRAHKEGKVIQFLFDGYWLACRNPTWKCPVETYRTKPAS